MKFAPTCCGKCSKYTRESCEARDGQCPAYRRELEASGFWEELRAWVLGGCKPEGKEVWQYWVRETGEAYEAGRGPGLEVRT